MGSLPDPMVDCARQFRWFRLKANCVKNSSLMPKQISVLSTYLYCQYSVLLNRLLIRPRLNFVVYYKTF